jgi:hypothetical protein
MRKVQYMALQERMMVTGGLKLNKKLMKHCKDKIYLGLLKKIKIKLAGTLRTHD